MIYNAKRAVHELIDELPDNAGWDDIVYRMAVRLCIEIGLAQSDADEGVGTATVRAELGLSSE